MNKVYKSIIDTIGGTPLVELKGIAKAYRLRARLLGKVESFNPGGSVKDRISLAMILDAEEKGLIKKYTVLIEPTSGNTGIGLAMVAASRGLRLILTMPDTMSIERRNLLKAYGAELILTDGALGMKGAIEKAQQLKEQTPNSIILSQFTNPANPNVHKATTGLEIYSDTGGNIDFLISGVGTGGTITGAGEYLKEKNPSIKIIAVEPLDSPVLSGGKAGPHKIQGIGAGFIPQILNTKIYDEVIGVSNADAIETAKMLARTDGILVGYSSGAALYAALEIAGREESEGKVIVVILPDSGERYLAGETF